MQFTHTHVHVYMHVHLYKHLKIYAQFLKFQKAVPVESKRGQKRKEAIFKRVSVIHS